MFNQTSDNDCFKIPYELANYFIKSSFNADIVDEIDLKNKVELFLKEKSDKHNYNSRLYEILLKDRQRELRYFVDSF